MSRNALVVLSLCLTLAAAPLAAGEGFWSSIGPDGGVVTALAAAPSHPFVLYAGVAGRGLYWSTDRGRHWGFSGFSAGAIYDLAVSPADPGVVYAALEVGFARSTDGGVSFETIGPRFARTTLVAVHPRDPRIVFAVLGGTLYRSTNGGDTRSTERGWPQGVRVLRFAPGRPDVVYAGAASGLWKSTDAGASWRLLSGKPGQIAALALDPRAPGVLYAGLVSGALLRSTDGGATWRRLLLGHGQPVTALALDPAASSTVYAAVGGELLRSLDGGAHWARTDTGLDGNLGILQPTRLGLLAGTSLGLFLSTDQAATFQATHRGIAFGIDELKIDGQTPPRLYARIGGRVLATADRGAHWQDVSPPWGPSDPYLSFSSLAVATDGSQTLYVTQSRQLARSTDGGSSWTVVRNACTAYAGLLLDPRDADHLFAQAHFFSGCGRIPRALVHSLDGGQSWQQLIAVEWSYLAIDPFDSSAYIQDGSGDLWQMLPGYELLFPGLSATLLVPSPRVPGTLWAVRSGTVGRSSDGGKTWTFSSTGLPDGADIVALTPDPADPATLYAGLAEQGVFRSTNGGATWSLMGRWQDGVRFQGGLLVDPADPSVLYAGTNTSGVLTFASGD